MVAFSSKLADWFVHYKRFGKYKRLFDRPTARLRPMATFPRTIHLYWDRGIEAAPPLVRRCIDSWVDRNPGWAVKVWDDDSVPLARSDFPEGVKTAAYSDMLRLKLLAEEGGVWVDATLMCLRPLDGWLPALMAETDFFAFRRPGPDREIGSWFLASRPGGSIVEALRSETGRFWQRRDTPTRSYFWFHYLFEYLVRTSPEFRREWNTTPSISAIPALALSNDLSAGTVDPDPSLYRAAPVAKLTYKRDWDVEEIVRLLGLD